MRDSGNTVVDLAEEPRYDLHRMIRWFLLLAVGVVGCSDRALIEDEPPEELRAEVEAYCRDWCPVAE